MRLDEIILSKNVLFDETEKLRIGGNKFLEHVSKYANNVVLLGFKPVFAKHLSTYVQKHLTNANLIFNSNSELTYQLVNEEKVDLEKYIFIATSKDELKEAEDWKIPTISFNCSENKTYHNFTDLKKISRYLSEVVTNK